ncbi:MAG: hypothetical protein SGJ21_06435 [Alphaproteobacteria bacterium]|nr:hypothetical protein [Alphaproteobacteria bacterium]
MSAKQHAFSREGNLTGLWSGEYWYGGVSFPTPFSAHFIDADGSLTGTTLEPQVFGDHGRVELSASLTGWRGDLSVRFTKLYDPAPDTHAHPIFYSGTVDAKFTLIDGDWNFGRADPAAGRFVLVRVSRGAKAEMAEASAVIALRR